MIDFFLKYFASLFVDITLSAIQTQNEYQKAET